MKKLGDQFLAGDTTLGLPPAGEGLKHQEASTSQPCSTVYQHGHQNGHTSMHHQRIV